MNKLNALHLCIDIQGRGSPYGNQLKRESSVLSNALKTVSVLTIYVAYIRPEACVPSVTGVYAAAEMPQNMKEFLRNHPMADFDLSITPTDMVAFKDEYSATEQIIDYTQLHDISDIILSGKCEATETAVREGWDDQCCVSATARDFKAAGMNVTIAAEATNLGSKMDTWWRRNPRYVPIEERQRLHQQWGISVQPVKKIIADLGCAVSEHGLPRTISGKLPPPGCNC